MERVILLMKYNSKFTLSENVLIINEQSALERRLGKKFADPSWTEKDPLYQWFKTFTNHDWAVFVSITTGLLGMIPTPASPVLLGISIAADLTDAKMYFDEGDPYMGSMIAALSIIPGHQLYKELKAAKTFKRIGVEQTKSLLKKASEGTITESDGKILKEVVSELAEESNVLTKLTRAELWRQIIVELPKKSLKFIWNFIINCSKILLTLSKEVIKLGIQIGAIYWTVDEIYLAVFHDDQKMLDIRKYSAIQQLSNWIKGNEKYFKELSIHLALEQVEMLNRSGVDPINVERPKEQIQSDIGEYVKNIKIKYEQDNLNKITAPSFNDVLSEKLGDDGTPITIHKGQQGDSVKKLQNLLKNDYEIQMTGMGQIENAVDGYFEEFTEWAVKDFQSKNGLKNDGIVGRKTLKKLLDIYINNNEKL